MRQSTRLILNTGATYVRMGVTVGIGLLVTRFLLRELKEEDFGLWGLVVSTVGWVSIFSDSLANAADRYLAYEIGKADTERLRRTFAGAVAMSLVAAALFLMAGAGLSWPLVHGLRIPEARSHAAAWAMFWTAVSTGFTVAQSPYRSLFVARQELALYSVIEISESVLRLAAAFVLMAIPGDRLTTLTLLLIGAQALSGVVCIGLCLKRYPESRVTPFGSTRAILREMTGFGAWSMLGNLAYRLRLSGPPTVLAASFGTVLNAAYAIANQVAGYQMQLASALSRASRPAIVNAKGAQNQLLATRLTLLTSKYSSWMVALPLVMIALETETILRIWLGAFPAAAPGFVRVVCGIAAVPWLVIGHYHAIIGTGRIRGIVVLSLVCDATAFAGSWAWAGLGGSAVGCLWFVLGGVCAFMLGSVAMFRKQTGVRPAQWAREVAWPVSASVCSAYAAGLLVSRSLDPGLFRVVCVGASSSLMFGVVCWAIGLTPQEREHFFRLARAVVRRVPIVGPRMLSRRDAAIGLAVGTDFPIGTTDVEPESPLGR